jgi:hypothetical protein
MMVEKVKFFFVVVYKKEKACCTMLLQLSERYTIEERRLYHARMSPLEEPVVPDSYTAMIRGLLWVSECYNMVGDKERSPCAWSVDLMTRTWMTYMAKQPALREDESLNSLKAYIMRFETLRAYRQTASEYEAYNEPLFCRQCRIPKVAPNQGSSWGPPPDVWGSVFVDSTSNDPPELEVLLPTDGMTRFHVDSHGVRWDMHDSLLVAGHTSQRDQHTGWGWGFHHH